MDYNLQRDALQEMVMVFQQNMIGSNQIHQAIYTGVYDAIKDSIRPIWQPISTAPVGEPSMDVGSRESSKPFLALKVSGEVVKVRRIGGIHTYDFAGYDSDATYYLEKCFTHWMPLPPTPAPQPQQKD